MPLPLHVAEYRLCKLDSELDECGSEQFMHAWKCSQTLVHRLADFISIDEQAIRMPDPRFPDDNGYHQYVVKEEGTAPEIVHRGRCRGTYSLSRRSLHV